MPILEDYIPDKPIYFEMRQQARRFLSSSMKGNQIASMIVVIVIFAITAYSFIVSAKWIHLSVPMFFLPVIVGLMLPGVLSGLISGEIQKRSIESLLATPLSARQLVLAKALRAVMPVMATLAAIIVLILILMLGKLFYGDDSQGDFNSAWLSIPCGIVIYLVFSFAVTGLSLAVSSVTRSAVASMVSTYGMMMLIYVIIPAIVTPIFLAIVGQSGNNVAYLASLHPYGMIAIATISNATQQVNIGGIVLMIAVGLLVQVLIGYMGLAFAAGRLTDMKRKGIEG
ncbi:MAG: ABC transporter permease [Fimbriimonadaceae bacterium]